MSDPRPIGIFDSGVGGLTVLREIVRRLPAESTIYLGDNARTPYGTRPDEEVLAYLPMAWVGDHLFSFAQWLYVGFTTNSPPMRPMRTAPLLDRFDLRSGHWPDGKTVAVEFNHVLPYHVPLPGGTPR